MKNKVKFLTVIGFMSAAGFVQSCTNLDENVYDKIRAEDYGTTQEQIDALIGPLYQQMGEYYGKFADLNSATDEMVVPTRGGDWKDGDKWLRLETHAWDQTLDDGLFNGIWTWCYGQAAAINAQLDNPLVTNAETRAGMRALRAWYHYIAMDNFGNVPIILEKTNPNAGSGAEGVAQRQAKDVYQFVESELLAALPDLSEEPRGVQYGRINRWVAHTILAKLYLNAEVYTGTAQWAKCIEQCDAIINSGLYSLNQDFFQNFVAKNDLSTEIILATPMDKTARPGFNFQYATLHYAHQQTYDLGNSPWNGYSAATEFYNLFDDDDVRKKMWLVGQQYDIDGKPLKDDTRNMILTPEIDSFVYSAGPNGRLKGARFAKYEIQVHNHTSDNSQDNDFVIYRLADVYMMRGEAKWRNGDLQGGVDDFNEIRRLRGVPEYTIATLTEEEMLAERGRELAFEFHRRQDQIRFGTWDDQTSIPGVTSNTDVRRKLYPIPQTQISLNPNLVQNDAYK